MSCSTYNFHKCIDEIEGDVNLYEQKSYTDLLFMKISRQDIAKAHVEYWLSTEMQNLKGGKGKICVFLSKGITHEGGETTNIRRT